MSEFLTAEQILAADDMQFVDVDVPEWGGKVRVTSLSAKSRDEYESSLVLFGPDGSSEAALDNLRAKLCTVCMVNENGERLFLDAAVDALGQKSCAALDRVFEVAKNLNRIGVKEIEELVKNSDETID